MTIEGVEKICCLSRAKIIDYEQKQLIPAAHCQNGIPCYTEEDCQRISFMKHLQYAGIDEDILKKYAAICQKKGNRSSEQNGFLMELHALLEERVASLLEIIDHLDCTMMPEHSMQ
ncbi:MAG: MerR family transcriptional regulator [Lachnospiraceae bacterium]|nr:MerR family transcriptional regulator [Lachnospiraceae bacterium]